MNDSAIRRLDSTPNGAHNSAIVSGFHLLVDTDGGVQLSQLRPDTIIEVQTKNTTYTVVPQASGESLIWGHPEYCPEPTLVAGLGSAYVTGLLREGYLGPGMRLSFPSQGKRISTSRIVEIKAKRSN